MYIYIYLHGNIYLWRLEIRRAVTQNYTGKAPSVTLTLINNLSCVRVLTSPLVIKVVNSQLIKLQCMIKCSK